MASNDCPTDGDVCTCGACGHCGHGPHQALHLPVHDSPHDGPWGHHWISVEDRAEAERAAESFLNDARDAANRERPK